jgi:hypothetical protein
VLDLFHQTVAILNRREQDVWEQQPEVSAPLTINARSLGMDGSHERRAPRDAAHRSASNTMPS